MKHISVKKVTCALMLNPSSQSLVPDLLVLTLKVVWKIYKSIGIRYTKNLIVLEDQGQSRTISNVQLGFISPFVINMCQMSS